jgi:hypothetical protein
MTNQESTRKEKRWPGEKWYDVDEADMAVEEGWYNEKLAQQCIKALERNNMRGYYAPTRSEALSQVMGMIPPGASVGIADSVTLFQVGVIEELEKRGNNETICAMLKEGKIGMPETYLKFKETSIKALTADIFITGTNAITLDGKILSTDQAGNRVAGLIFGPEKVIIVVGINKIVANLEEAWQRVKRIAAPVVAYRHQVKHGMKELPPCGLSRVCVECNIPVRICCYTVVVEFEAFRRRIEVVLVGENLGA